MKILIISDAWHPQVNGVVRTYEHISAELIKKGHDVKVIGPSDFSWKIGMPSYSEIKLVLFPYVRLKKMIQEYDPDVVHLSVEGPLGWAGRKYCVQHKIKFSTSYHTHFPHYLEERLPVNWSWARKYAHQFGRWYVRKFHEPSDAMMVASPSLEDVLNSWKFNDNIHRLTRGVDTDSFYLGKANLFKNLKRPIALYVGRIAVEKNLESFLSVPWKGTKVLVGNGPAHDSLREKFPDAIFAGIRKGVELGDYYRSSDIFVFPSKTDTFGIVILEALACGIPVAAYPVTGPKDIIKEDFLGSLDNDLSKAIKKAIKNDESDKRAAYILEHYTWEKAAEQFLHVFEEVSNESVE